MVQCENNENPTGNRKPTRKTPEKHRKNNLKSSEKTTKKQTTGTILDIAFIVLN